MMYYQKIKKSSGEIYFALCKNKRNPLLRNKVDDVKILIDVIQRELICSFESEFLNACYSVWLRYAKQIGIKDCTYHPRSFRLLYSNEPYAISNYDAYCIFKLLSAIVNNEDICVESEKWMNLYLGKNYDYSNPVDNCVDVLLKRIDDGLIQKHSCMICQYDEFETTFDGEPTAQQIIQTAKLNAQSIVEQAKAKEGKIITEAEKLSDLASKLRREGELAAREFYVQAEKAEQLRKHQAEEIVVQAKQDAKRMIDDAIQNADKLLAASQKKAQVLIDKASAKANTIRQTALEEKYLTENSGLKDNIELVIQQFRQTQEAMRALEEQFDQMKLMKIFNTFYSLYELIALNKRSLQSLPDEYNYISDNMDVFLEVIQEGLADFGIQTFVSEPESPYIGKMHDVQGNTMFDPATAAIECSVRPGFVNSSTGNVLQKEQVKIIYK